MPPKFRPRKPDFVLKAYQQSDGGRTIVGSAWYNTDGSISIQLNPCVILRKQEGISFTLWPEVPTTE